MLVTTFELEEQRPAGAIQATVARRDTAVPSEVPTGLTSAFAEDPGKQRQWQAFARNLAGQVPDLATIVSGIHYKFAPHFAAT
jgi:hypothetical protein